MRSFCLAKTQLKEQAFDNNEPSFLLDGRDALMQNYQKDLVYFFSPHILTEKECSLQLPMSLEQYAYPSDAVHLEGYS